MRSAFSFLMAGMLFASISAASIGPEDFPAPGTRIWIGKHSLHLNCQGRGSPAVVFDSGLGGTSLDWALVQPEVAGFTRACTYDRAGYGWSGRGPRPRSSARIVSELNSLLGYGGVAPPYILVGHSFGGLNVRLFAHSHPHKTAGLVLVDSSHEEQFDRFEDANISTVVPRSDRFFIANYYRIPDGLPSELRPIAQAFAVSPRAVESLYSELRHMRVSAAQVRAARSLPDVPIVVVSRGGELTAGDARPIDRLWLELQTDLASRTTHGRLVVAQTGDHYIQLRKPEVVVEAIREVVSAARDLEVEPPIRPVP